MTTFLPDETLQRLKTFLAAPARQEGTLGYEALMGFLFLLACTPERVPPAEWLPVVLPGEGDIPPQQQAPALRQGIQDVLACFKSIQQQVEDDAPSLPPGCAPAPEAARNFGPEGALGRWSGGLLIGLHWLSETWEYALDDESDEAFSAITMILSFFTSRELAEEYRQDFEDPSTSIDVLAADLLEAVPDALHALAELGRSLDYPDDEGAGTSGAKKPGSKPATASTAKKKGQRNAKSRR